MSDAVVVTDNLRAHRFEAYRGPSGGPEAGDGDLMGFAEYELTDHTIVFTHTVVDPAFEGRGVGSALVRHALDAVRADGELQVVPRCPFVAAWIERHPAYRDLLAAG